MYIEIFKGVRVIMEIREIIENLRYNTEHIFQKESVIEARKNKKEITEELLKELEKIADNIEYYAQEANYILDFYAMYLLAEFREKRAFPIIIKLITNKNQEIVDCLLGDLATGDLKKILASTFDGNVDALYNIITNLELNEYIRGSAFGALEILQKYDVLEQKQIIAFIEKIVDNELKDDYSVLITDIVVYIMENKLYDKIELVKKLYREDRVSEDIIGGYDDFIDEIYGNKQSFENKNMIEDTVKSLSWWACFNKESKKDVDFGKALKDLMRFENAQVNQVIQRNKKIGRNDLCPCGSGKKYKKCCIDKEEQVIVTPADVYIQKSLQDYPKEELKKFYDEEVVAIDEKLYQVLKYKAIPLWVKRNYAEESRRNAKNMEEALKLIEEKCKKDKIHTLDEFNSKLAIHYDFEEIVEGYLNVLNKTGDLSFELTQNIKVEFLLQILPILDINVQLKKFYINSVIDEYLEKRYYCEAKYAIQKIKTQMPEMEMHLLKVNDVEKNF